MPCHDFFQIYDIINIFYEIKRSLMITVITKTMIILKHTKFWVQILRYLRFRGRYDSWTIKLSDLHDTYVTREKLKVNNDKHKVIKSRCANVVVLVCYLAGSMKTLRTVNEQCVFHHPDWSHRKIRTCLTLWCARNWQMLLAVSIISSRWWQGWGDGGFIHCLSQLKQPLFHLLIHWQYSHKNYPEQQCRTLHVTLSGAQTDFFRLAKIHQYISVTAFVPRNL